MRLLFATGNMGKLKEVSEKFSDIGIEVEQLEDEYPEVQADELEAVVEWGLDWLRKRHKTPLVIDDSGLFIDDLGGFPGVYSAYVFKTLGCKGILKLLEGRENRQAEFRCCAGYIDRNGRSVTVTGRVQGLIIGEMRGSGGFGYDPIFVPAGEDRTFAEMSVAGKNTLSHRGKAFDLLIREIKTLER